MQWITNVGFVRSFWDIRYHNIMANVDSYEILGLRIFSSITVRIVYEAVYTWGFVLKIIFFFIWTHDSWQVLDGQWNFGIHLPSDGNILNAYSSIPREVDISENVR